MYLKKIKGPRAITLRDGSIFTLADLPPKDTRRWVASRKAAVVTGVTQGLITPKEATERWSLSADELAEWVRAIAEHGEGALKTTRLQQYRQP